MVITAYILLFIPWVFLFLEAFLLRSELTKIEKAVVALARAIGEVAKAEVAARKGE